MQQSGRISVSTGATLHPVWAGSPVIGEKQGLIMDVYEFIKGICFLTLDTMLYHWTGHTYWNLSWNMSSALVSGDSQGQLKMSEDTEILWFFQLFIAGKVDFNLIMLSFYLTRLDRFILPESVNLTVKYWELLPHSLWWWGTFQQVSFWPFEPVVYRSPGRFSDLG